jgi:hypothetical protein
MDGSVSEGINRTYFVSYYEEPGPKMVRVQNYCCFIFD